MMTFINLEKYVYSKKCLKQRRQPLTPPSSKVECIFAPKKSPGYACYFHAIEFAYPSVFSHKLAWISSDYFESLLSPSVTSESTGR